MIIVVVVDETGDTKKRCDPLRVRQSPAEGNPPAVLDSPRRRKRSDPESCFSSQGMLTKPRERAPRQGKTTDYVAKQYIGNLGKTAQGIVSVNAYAVVSEITYPLLFKIFKPRKCLKPGDEYKTKPEIAQQIIQEITEWGFRIKLVLADSLLA